MTTCLRCKKPLADPISLARGYGDTCWAQALSEVPAYIQELESSIQVVPGQKDGYYGLRVNNHCKVVCVHQGMIFDLVNTKRSSSESYSWGYGGSGPAALAHSILTDALRQEASSDLIQEIHQSCKWDLITPIQADQLEIPLDAVLAWFEEHRPGQIEMEV